jgi:hypothetical protein
MAADKKIYITKSPEQVVTEDVTEETTKEGKEEIREQVAPKDKVGAAEQNLQDAWNKWKEQQQVAPKDKVGAAEQNLQDAWNKWKEQQRTTGIAFDPRSRAAQDVALTRAVYKRGRCIYRY